MGRLSVKLMKATRRSLVRLSVWPVSQRNGSYNQGRTTMSDDLSKERTGEGISPTRRHADTPVQVKPFLLERIIEASSRNTFLVLILTLFGIAGRIWALTKTPLDAIPDLSDVQVIVYTDWEGRSTYLVEDQITYPISTRFIAAPKVKFVRGESMFGKSFIYVIFEDGLDIN